MSKSSTDEYRISVNEIITELSRNNDFSNAAREKVENINISIVRYEDRNHSNEDGFMKQRLSFFVITKIQEELQIYTKKQCNNFLN